jgi:hypothetical protein
MSPDRTRNVSGFMAAFRAATQETYDPSWRVYEGEVEISLASPETSTVPLEPHEVYLSSIEACHPGEGHGSLALDWLTTLAEDYEVAILLEPEPFKRGKGLMGEDELIDWYQRHGFQQTEFRLMVYVPDALKGLYSPP